jgi:hypothetical protein
MEPIEHLDYRTPTRSDSLGIELWSSCHRSMGSLSVRQTPPLNKALQLTANSAPQLRFCSILAFNLGDSATFGGAVVRS